MSDRDDAPDDAVQAGAMAWLLAQWADRGTERPPRCPVCGAVAVLVGDRWTQPHDPVRHGVTPPDPTREPDPAALAAVRRALGERDDPDPET